MINHLHRISYMVEGMRKVFRMWRRVLGGWGCAADYMFRGEGESRLGTGVGWGMYRIMGLCTCNPCQLWRGVVVSKDDCLPFNIDTSSQVSDNAACPVCAGESEGTMGWLIWVA